MSYKHEIIFTLNNKEKLLVSGEHPDDVCCCCCEATVNFFAEDTRYELGNVCVGSDMSVFGVKLEKALQGELKLDESIASDIGYSWNVVQHYSYNDLGPVPGFVYERKERQDYDTWVGDNHEILSTSVFDKLGTWLYNDAEGSIIFEIAPIYPWHRYDSETEPIPEGFIPYEEFMKNYKPCLMRKIPTDVAGRWAEQAKYGSQAIYEILAQEQAEFEAQNVASETEDLDNTKT